MEKLIYYQGELLTPEQRTRILNVWGEWAPAWRFEEMDHNYGTGLHEVTEIFATIQCNRVLNERFAALEARIWEKLNSKKKVLTDSRSRSFQFVEESMLWDIVSDAIDLFNKESDDEKLNTFQIRNYSFIEICRLCKIPTKSIMKEVEECERKIGNVPAFTGKTPELKGWSISQDYGSALKEYFFDLKNRYHFGLDKIENRLRNEFKFFCGITPIQYGNGKPFCRITVYDYKNSDNAFNIIFEKVMKECNLFE
jgi:hypothetical protein